MCTRRSPGRRRLAALTVSVVALLAGIPSASAERLAVLEIKGADLEPKALAYLSRRVRGEALKHLPAGWEVMTRDNMLVLIDAAQGQCVKEGECEVETGRHIGADVVVAGEVVRLAGRLRLTLHAYETRGGRLLRTAEAAEADLAALVEALPTACERLLKGAADGPRPPGEPPQATPPPARGPPAETAPAPGQVAVAVRAEDDDGDSVSLPLFFDGVDVGATPWERRVDAGRHHLGVRGWGREVLLDPPRSTLVLEVDKPLRTGPWLVLGLGVGLGVLGAVFQSETSGSAGGPAGEPINTDEDRQTAAIVLYTLGGITVATGTLLLLFGESHWEVVGFRQLAGSGPDGR